LKKKLKIDCTGRKAFYANQKVFKSKLVSKKAKLQLKLKVITFASKTWVLKESVR
jgi:hypothetical protein